MDDLGFFADSVTTSASTGAEGAAGAGGHMNPDDEGFLSEFELILPKFVSILKAIQDGGEDRDIVRLVPTPCLCATCICLVLHMISIFLDAQTSDLNAHFKKCNQTLDELPGTDLTHAQQQALLRQYQDQLKRKRCRVRALW